MYTNIPNGRVFSFRLCVIFHSLWELSPHQHLRESIHPQRLRAPTYRLLTFSRQSSRWATNEMYLSVIMSSSSPLSSALAQTMVRWTWQNSRAMDHPTIACYLLNLSTNLPGILEILLVGRLFTGTQARENHPTQLVQLRRGFHFVGLCPCRFSSLLLRVHYESQRLLVIEISVPS